MSKIKKVYIPIFISILFILTLVLLAYNSFFNLSYTKRKINNYTFMLPKKIKYNINVQSQNTIFKLTGENILNSLLTVYSGKYELAKLLAQSYTFYNSKVDIISKDEKILYGKKLYSILKKLTYYDNDKTTYMFIYLYEIDSENTFVISIECDNLKDAKNYMKKMDKTVRSIKIY